MIDANDFDTSRHEPPQRTPTLTLWLLFFVALGGAAALLWP